MNKSLEFTDGENDFLKILDVGFVGLVTYSPFVFVPDDTGVRFAFQVLQTIKN